MTNITVQNNHNVLTFRRAINNGYNPSDYSYDKDDIPTGEYNITLDFMIWSKKLPAIECFCSIRQTGQKIRLSVFKDRDRGTYNEVALLPSGSTLSIQVELNGNGNPVLAAVSPVTT